MLHGEQVALIKRALALLDSAGSERGEPAASPVSRYLDPQRFERELQQVFRQHPLALCAAARLSDVGDTLAVDVAGMPLLLVRQPDGSLAGFVNACRHRGARLAPEGASHHRALVCPYHSWTYGLDGTLRGRPHGDDFPHAPAERCRLARVPVGEALGLAWAIPRIVAPGEDVAIDLAAWLGRFGRDLRGWGYDGWVPFHEREFVTAANWKIPFEANLETYHFQYAHRDSIAHLFHDNLLLADVDRDHQRLVLPKRTIGRLRETPEAQWSIGPHSNIIYHFFPATFVLHEGDHCNLFTVLPEAVDRSRVRAITLIPEPPRSDKAVEHWRKNVASFWGALDEDFALGASCQSTLASGANEALRFGRTECASARFHASVERCLAGDAR